MMDAGADHRVGGHALLWGVLRVPHGVSARLPRLAAVGLYQISPVCWFVQFAVLPVLTSRSYLTECINQWF